MENFFGIFLAKKSKTENRSDPLVMTKLIILVDGALVHQRNQMLKEEQLGKKLDYTTIQTMIKKNLNLDADIQTSAHWFMVGSSNADTFVKKMEETGWRTHPFPLRAFAREDEKVKFTSVISLILGTMLDIKEPRTVAIVSQDPALVFSVKYIQSNRNLNVSICWPDPFSSEMTFFLTREQIHNFTLTNVNDDHMHSCFLEDLESFRK
jgi:hypothetical protein